MGNGVGAKVEHETRFVNGRPPGAAQPPVADGAGNLEVAGSGGEIGLVALAQLPSQSRFAVGPTVFG